MEATGSDGRGLLVANTLVFSFVEGLVTGRAGEPLGTLDRRDGVTRVLDRAGEVAWTIRIDGFWRWRFVVSGPDGEVVGSIRKGELLIDDELVAWFQPVRTPTFSSAARFDIVGGEVLLGEVRCEVVRRPGRRRPVELVRLRFHRQVERPLRLLMATVPHLCQGASDRGD